MSRIKPIVQEFDPEERITSSFYVPKKIMVMLNQEATRTGLSRNKLIETILTMYFEQPIEENQ